MAPLLSALFLLIIDKLTTMAVHCKYDRVALSFKMCQYASIIVLYLYLQFFQPHFLIPVILINQRAWHGLRFSMRAAHLKYLHAGVQSQAIT